MEIVNNKDYKYINSNTCGLLTELLNNSTVPVSVTKAENLESTIKHAHKKSTEIFWVTEGTIEIELTNKKGTKSINLVQGSILVVEPGEFHSVINSSEANTVIVLSSPPWSPDDELVR